MASKTKAELEAELEEVKAKLQEEKAKNQGLHIDAGVTEGYLVTTPMPYDGVTFGVNFRNGRAFIPKGVGADEQALVEDIVRRLKSDFGYEALKVGADEIEALRQSVPEVDEEIKASIADDIVLPQVMGGE